MNRVYRWRMGLTPEELLKQLQAAGEGGFIVRARGTRLQVCKPRVMLGEAVKGQTAFRGHMRTVEDGLALDGVFSLPWLPLLLFYGLGYLAWLTVIILQRLSLVSISIVGPVILWFIWLLNAIARRIFKKENDMVIGLLNGIAQKHPYAPSGM